MFNIRYRLLCSVTIRHDYFQDGRTNDFTIVPTLACEAFCGQFGLIIKQTTDGIALLQSIENDLPEIAINGSICLSFLVYLNNSSLLNVSNLEDERRFYLTNLKEDGTFKNELTQQSKLSKQDKLPRISKQHFNLNFPKGQFHKLKLKRLEVKKGLNDLPVINNEANKENLEITLNQTGFYELTKDPLPAGENPENIIANDEVANSRSFFALLDLYLDDTVPEKTKYTLTVGFRQFNWHYVLIDTKRKNGSYGQLPAIQLTYTKNHNDNAPNVPSPYQLPVQFKMIEANDRDAAVQKIIQQIKQTNQNAINEVFTFKSDIPIPILGYLPPNVELSVDGNNNFAKMPIPDISTVNILADDALIYFNI